MKTFAKTIIAVNVNFSELLNFTYNEDIFKDNQNY